MKNSRIHKGLPDEEVRDFLSFSLLKNTTSKIEMKLTPDIRDDGEWVIKDAELKIDYYQKVLESQRIQQAILKIIHTQNWLEFDVSDYTVRDMKYNHWMSFIGTGEEYNKLMDYIKQTKNY